MATVADIIEESGLSREGNNWTKERAFLVTGVTGTDAEREKDAIDTVNTDESVTYGTRLSSDSSDDVLYNMYAASARVEPVQGQPNTLKVVWTYVTWPTFFELSFSSTAVRVDATKDKDGNQITVQHDGVTKGAVAQVTDVERTLTAVGREIGLDIDTVQETFVNRVNTTEWRGSAAGTWLCTNIEGVTGDDGVTWETRYSFQYRSDGWQPEVVFTNDETGDPETNLVSGEGIKTVQWYSSADFNELPF